MLPKSDGKQLGVIVNNKKFTSIKDENHFYKKITVTDPSLKHPLGYTEKVAKFSLGDFTDMLSFQELQVQEVFGDYQFGHYEMKQSPRLIILAKK